MTPITTGPCVDCEWRRPELDPANHDALELWLELQTQWRVGFSGPTGLDYPAVYAEAQRLDIDLSNCVIRKIKALERLTLNQNRNRNQSTKTETE